MGFNHNPCQSDWNLYMAEQKSLLESTVRGFHVYALIDQDIVCLFFNML